MILISQKLGDGVLCVSDTFPFETKTAMKKIKSFLKKGEAKKKENRALEGKNEDPMYEIN